MKKSLVIIGVLAVKVANPARAALEFNESWNVGQAIPEGNPTGIALTESLAGIVPGTIQDVSVNLDITGGYNGGLYAYLVLQEPDGTSATEVLLNQIGTTPSNPFGSSGAGLNVTLSDSGTVNGTIHNASGSPTGVWQPDSSATLDGTFGGMVAGGTWTLFLADEFEGGGASTLTSWGLNLSVIPEAAQTGWIYGLGGLVVCAGVWLGRRRLAA